MALDADFGAGELHVVSSAAQPCVPVSTARLSKSQRRRHRMRKCAILKSKVASSDLKSVLALGSVVEDTPENALELRLRGLEEKLDQVLLAIMTTVLQHRNVHQTCSGALHQLSVSCDGCGSGLRHIL